MKTRTFATAAIAAFVITCAVGTMIVVAQSETKDQRNHWQLVMGLVRADGQVLATIPVHAEDYPLDVCKKQAHELNELFDFKDKQGNFIAFGCSPQDKTDV